MRRFIIVVALLFVGILETAPAAIAQSALLNLPLASQGASVTQRVGITDITITYHRPVVNNRQIFGGLVGYGEVWRAGANQNTTIQFTDPVSIEGQPLAKGVYGLHMIPGETSWVVIFSKNSTSWGSFTYDLAEDALRVTVKPQTVPNRETLSYDFDDLQPDSAVIAMRWSTVEVPFKVEVNTHEIVAESLRNQLRGRAQFEWQAWTDAANYLLNNNFDAQEAEKYAQQSIRIEDRFENEMTKSRALKALGYKQEAQAAYDKAVSVGNQSQLHDFGRALQAHGHQEEALALFRRNIQKDPNSWIGHNEAARVAAAQGDYSTALKEMKRAANEAPEPLKNQHLDLVRRLQNKEDINR